MKKRALHKRSAGKLALILCNALLVLSVVAFVLYYTARVRTNQDRMVLGSFCDTVDTMKQISTRYLDSERSVVQDWAAYIEHENMDIDEVLAYLRVSNTSQERYAHLVDMDTFESRSSYLRSDGDIVSIYQRFTDPNWNSGSSMIETMRLMFDGGTAVLGKYKINESQMTVISVGTRVTLRTAEGGSKPYLLLRVIPVESMRKLWIFPLNYTDAEIGLITTICDYVIPSNAMRSENFIEFIRAYNFADDYNGVDALLTQLQTTDSGLLTYNNSREEPCYWYYTKLGDYAGLVMVGYVPQKSLTAKNAGMPVALIICGLLLMLVLLDGAYVLNINRRLRVSVKLAEQASEAKTQFLSTMSHDIRTPLNAVIGMTQLAQDHSDDPAYVADCLNKISVSGNHLLTLINDILELSRVESGKTTITPAPFSVEELAAGLESITRPQAEGRGQQLKVQLHDIAQPYLIGDKLRLSQIYLNLLNNAVKYTQPDGSIRLTLWETPQDDTHVYLFCAIADNGMGMSPDFQKTMYESFSRAEDGRIDKTQGTGLGLSIVKHMIDLMDGTILCESQLGEGTTFTVRIPLAITDHAEQPAVQFGKAGENILSGMRVLIAEDNDLNWEIIEAMLEEHHIACDRAENGRVCVEKLESAPAGAYGLVLMDVQMPEMNGREAARVLRKSTRQDLREIPIAAMTADAFAEDMQACLDAGMDAHLSKPIEIDKVLRVFAQLKGFKHSQ